MPNLNPTVFVVDPDLSVQASLSLAIRRAGWWPETFWTMRDFLARRPAPGPGCLLLDGDAPEVAGFDLVRRLVAERKETPVVVMSSRSDVPLTVEAMQAGAAGFLVKPLAHDAVLAALGRALETSRVVLDEQRELLLLRNRYHTLSSREREVMGRVVAGLLNKQVGAVLGISEITVKAHRGRVMRKMEATSLAALVGMALRLQLPMIAIEARWTGAVPIRRTSNVIRVPAARELVGA
jgi:FixJ family two-component response regulator